MSISMCRKWFLWLAIWLCLSGCLEEETLDSQVVVIVEAYIFAGQPVNRVRLRHLNEVHNTLGEFISDAEVTIVWNKVRYPLVMDLSKRGNYLYEGNDLFIQSGETYFLEIRYRGNLLTAQTIVPKSPIDVSVSNDTLVLEELPTGVEVGKEALDMFWEEIEQAAYLIATDNDPENMDFIPFNNDSPEAQEFFNIEGIFLSDDSVTVFEVNFDKYGDNDLILMTVDSVYLDFFRQRNQLIEHFFTTKTNIDGGGGLFSSFATDTTQIFIKKE